MSSYPDLYALIFAYGGWHLVPVAAWAAYDAAVADYWATKTAKLRNEQALNMGPSRPKTSPARTPVRRRGA